MKKYKLLITLSGLLVSVGVFGQSGGATTAPTSTTVSTAPGAPGGNSANAVKDALEDIKAQGFKFREDPKAVGGKRYYAVAVPGTGHIASSVSLANESEAYKEAVLLLPIYPVTADQATKALIETNKKTAEGLIAKAALPQSCNATCKAQLADTAANLCVPGNLLEITKNSTQTDAVDIKCSK